MSIIAAGTTSGTALVSTGDTNGTLVIQTNGTTVAATFGTDQSLTVVGALTIGSAAQAVPSGSAPLFAARAWVNFNGTGTVAIRASGNVTSITDSGTGLYIINFTTAMPDANFAAVFGTNPYGFNGTYSGSPGDTSAANSTTQCFIATRDASNVNADSDFIMCAILR